MACDTARTIAPDLRIGSASDGSARPAQSKQVRQLIADLLDDRPLREGQVLAFRTERMMEVDTVMQMAAGKIPAIMPPGGINSNRNTGAQGAIGTLLAPQFYADGRFMLEYTSAVLQAARAPDLPTSRARMNVLPDLNRQRGAAHLMLSILLPAFGRAIEQDFRILTDSRLTALMLACRLYAIDHGGKFPDMLDDLVPDYIPTIPADPFSTGSPLRYRPGLDPVVYSVGDNGADDGGSERVVEKGPGAQANKWAQADYVIHLIRQPRPATAPSE